MSLLVWVYMGNMNIATRHATVGPGVISHTSFDPWIAMAESVLKVHVSTMCSSDSCTNHATSNETDLIQPRCHTLLDYRIYRSTDIPTYIVYFILWPYTYFNRGALIQLAKSENLQILIHDIKTGFVTNRPYSLFVRASYFISCSVYTQFTSVIFIVCKWHWGYRYFLTSHISMLCIEAFELIIR